MTQLPPGMFRPGDSLLHQLDGAVKTLCLAFLLFATVIAVGPAGHLTVLILTACVVYLSELSFKETTAPIKDMGFLLFIIFVLNACFYAPQLAFVRWWIFAPSAAGIIHGAGLVLKLSCSVLLCCLLCATTPPLRLLAGIEKLLWPFARMGLPTGKLALLFSVALQFIPNLYKEAGDIRHAQLARGARFESKSYFDRARALLPLYLPLFIAAFRRAGTLAEAMAARGYRAEGGRRQPDWEKLSLIDWAALTVCAAALALELVFL